MNKRNAQIIYIVLTFATIAITPILLFLYNYTITNNHPSTISDKLELTNTAIKRIIRPRSIKKLQKIIRSKNGPIAIAGASYSQGGQIAITHGIVIDTHYLNKIINFDSEKKTITVQAGATWYDVQNHIDPYNLSIASMQSYNDFSVGGSLSVNVHGRDIHHSQLINTVKSIQIITADGSLITADREQNNDIFKAAIGGYGLLGIITQATLQLTDNIPLERDVKACLLENFDSIFFNTIATDDSVVFYNTDLFPNQYKKCLITTWRTTNKPITDPTRLQKQSSPFYIINQALEMFVKRIPLAKYSRFSFEQLKTKSPLVVWRNNEMSYTVNQLTIHSHFPTTMALQEYFIPVKHAQEFAKKLRSILKKNRVNVLNVSIRHVKADTTSIMSYAQKESFSFVLYFNIFNLQKSIDQSCIWTQQIINAALKNDGSYYLPYLMCATKKQFNKAYPQFKKLLEIKKIYDPNNKFQNMLFKKYVK
jgi:FAD/FMN-containing dehydrogenase